MAGPAYQWGAWRFEPTECRLLRNAEIVPLPAKTLDVLAALLRRAPRLVTKEEIFAAVWPDAAVEEGNIAFHVAALRKALDEQEGVSAIETVRGRGYRFVEPFTIEQMPPTDAIQQWVSARPDVASEPETTPPAEIAAPEPPVEAKSRTGLVIRMAIAVLVAALIAAIFWLR